MAALAQDDLSTHQEQVALRAMSTHADGPGGLPSPVHWVEQLLNGVEQQVFLQVAVAMKYLGDLLMLVQYMAAHFQSWTCCAMAWGVPLG